MFGAGAVCAIAFLAATTPHGEAAAAIAGFDWNHLLQVLFASLAAYFGGRHGSRS